MQLRDERHIQLELLLMVSHRFVANKKAKELHRRVYGSLYCEWMRFHDLRKLEYYVCTFFSSSHCRRGLKNIVFCCIFFITAGNSFVVNTMTL